MNDKYIKELIDSKGLESEIVKNIVTIRLLDKFDVVINQNIDNLIKIKVEDFLSRNDIDKKINKIVEEIDITELIKERVNQIITEDWY